MAILPRLVNTVTFLLWVASVSSETSVYSVPDVPATLGSDAVITCYVEQYYKECTPQYSNSTCRVTFYKGDVNITSLSDDTKYVVEHFEASTEDSKVMCKFSDYSFTDTLKAAGAGFERYYYSSCFYSTLTIKEVGDTDLGSYSCKGYTDTQSVKMTVYDASDVNYEVVDNLVYFTSDTLKSSQKSENGFYDIKESFAVCVYSTASEGK